MEKLIKNKITKQDIINIYESEFIDWNLLKNKTVLITGATGTIGSFIIRSLLYANEETSLNIKIVALARNAKKMKTFFKSEIKHRKIKVIIQDIKEKIKYNSKVDFIIHCASNTNSKFFVNKPLETVENTVNGTKNILEFAAMKKNIQSMVYLSSMEVYGLIGFDKEKVYETDCGLIDILNPRSSYPQAKRTAEILCFSYFKEKSLPVKIARLAQTFGSNVDYDDSRVFAQFARSIVERKDIILNTQGNSTRSYCYITDAITGIFRVLLNGENGEAYNVANEESTKSIKEVALMLCEKYPNTSLLFEPNNTIYPPESNWKLDTTKIKKLGWVPVIPLETMFDNLINSFYKQKISRINDNLKSLNETISFLQKICSFKNLSDHKVITFMGIKFKFKIDCFNKISISQARKKLGINPNKIVFCNYKGSGFGCNPKYIALEILKQNLPFEMVWLLKDDEFNKIEDFPKEIKIVNYSSKQALIELATSKFWVTNYHKNHFIKKGLTKAKEQVYIQTWHGSLGIKKIDRNVASLTCNLKWLNAAVQNSKITDFWISNSKWESEIYKKAFWSVENIKEFGHPRNDIFFYENQEEIKNNVYEELSIPKNKKIVLYAPSFREDESFDYYNLKYQNVLRVLKHKFGGDWCFLVRFHPRIKTHSKVLLEFSNDVVDATSYSDIQELLVASDCMITDYSSCIFDFMLSGKPAFIYATDIKKYNQERGFYYPLEHTPFPISTDNTSLTAKIVTFDFERYKDEVKEFLLNKGCIENGHAAEKTVALISDIAKIKNLDKNNIKNGVHENV